MILPETENVSPVNVSVQEAVISNALCLSVNGWHLALDRTTAKVLLPVLLHFIETVELPE